MNRGLLLLMTPLVMLAACDDDGFEPVDDASGGEQVVDTMVRDGVTDSVADVGQDQRVDGAGVPTQQAHGELASGAAVSKGGDYVLYSQVGHWSAPNTITGGGYSLRWNAPVFTW